MKKSTAILLLLPFVLLFVLFTILIGFYPVTYLEGTMPIIDVYNLDDVATYQVDIIINGQNNSYVMQPHDSISIPKEYSKTSDYDIQIFINGSIQYSDTVSLQKTESLLSSIKYGKLDTGEVSA